MEGLAGLRFGLLSMKLIIIPGVAIVMLHTKEHYDLMAKFERDFKHERLDKEDKELWSKGRIYQSGAVNSLFLAYRLGYSFGKVA